MAGGYYVTIYRACVDEEKYTMLVDYEKKCVLYSIYRIRKYPDRRAARLSVGKEGSVLTCQYPIQLIEFQFWKTSAPKNPPLNNPPPPSTDPPPVTTKIYLSVDQAAGWRGRGNIEVGPRC